MVPYPWPALEKPRREVCGVRETIEGNEERRPERLPRILAAASRGWLEFVAQCELHHARAGEQAGVVAERARVCK